MTSAAPSPMDRRHTLRDGRRIGYAEVGDPGGVPLFFIGGFPGSRLMAGLLRDVPAGVRLIGLDRPGSGLSDPRRGWSLLDWPHDVAELADSLSIDRFGLLAWSGGAPHALASLVVIPERVAACGLVGGMVPPDIPVGRAMIRNRVWRVLARQAPLLLRPMVWLLYGRLGADPQRFRKSLEAMQSEISAADRRAYADPDVMDTMARGMAEAYRQGTGPQAYEAGLLNRPWGFQLAEVAHPHVFLWHGTDDSNVPIDAARRSALLIRGSVGTFLEGEGHLSPLTGRGGEIVRALLRAM